jgi:hypothetical protein
VRIGKSKMQVVKLIVVIGHGYLLQSDQYEYSERNIQKKRCEYQRPKVEFRLSFFESEADSDMTYEHSELLDFCSPAFAGRAYSFLARLAAFFSLADFCGAFLVFFFASLDLAIVDDYFSRISTRIGLTLYGSARGSNL